MNLNGFGTVHNFTVGVGKNGDLVISKVNGISTAAADSQKLKAIIIKNGINQGRSVYVASKFYSAAGSNHAEMCVLAGGQDLGIDFVVCTGPNCAFCKVTLEHYGVKSGNRGVGGSQMGWSHPFFPLGYGSQLDGSQADQLNELKRFHEFHYDRNVIKLGRWGTSNPRYNNKIKLC
jgi:hypothetical protein